VRRQRIALILGAGWSAAAGYPLARDLITGPIYVATHEAGTRVRAVLRTFASWSAERPGGAAEVFLAEVLAGTIKRTPTKDAPTLFDADGGPPLPWDWAVEAVQLRLAQLTSIDAPEQLRTEALVYPPRHVSRLRYSANLTLPANSVRHTAFIRAILSGEAVLAGVVTTNYDTLAERVLRHRPMVRDPEPGFYYGGLPRPQHAHGHLPWDRSDPHMSGRFGEVELTGAVPVCKLHGSSNWQRRGREIGLYRDQRLAYRHGGTAAIIPPTAEKQAEPWLSSVWTAAETILTTSHIWIVVGYSLPMYDHAIRDLLGRTARAGVAHTLVLHDPRAEQLSAQWSEVTGLEIVLKPGL
jgi:hypothetical protein